MLCFWDYFGPNLDIFTTFLELIWAFLDIFEHFLNTFEHLYKHIGTILWHFKHIFWRISQCVILQKSRSFFGQISEASKIEKGPKMVLKLPKMAKKAKKGIRKVQEYRKNDKIGPKVVQWNRRKMAKNDPNFCKRTHRAFMTIYFDTLPRVFQRKFWIFALKFYSSASSWILFNKLPTKFPNSLFTF